MQKPGPLNNYGINFSIIPIIPGVVSLLSIQLTYWWALSNGHVKPFPYITISKAAEHYPECMLFRAGIIICCVFIAITFHVVAWWLDLLNDRTGKYVYVNINKIRNLGFLAGILLTFSTATISDGKDMNGNLHVVCATGFFIVVYYNLVQVINILNQLWQYRPRLIPCWSYYYKLVMKYVGGALFLLDIVSGIFPHYFDHNIGNYIEWYATYLILGTFVTIAVDMRYVSVYFALHMCS